MQDGLGPGRVLEAALPLELVLQLAVAFEHRVQIVGRFGHAVFELVHLVLYRLKLAEGRERGFVDGRARLEVNVLFEQAEPQAARTHNVAAIRRLFAVDEAEQGGLARAVAAHQPDVLAGVDLQRRAAQDLLRRVGLVNVSQAEKHRRLDA